MLTGDRRPRRVKSLATVPDGPNLLVANLLTSRLTTLQGSAIEIWQLLEGDPTLSEMANALVALHPEVDPRRLVEQLVEFVDELSRAGLVETSPSGHSPAFDRR